MRDGAEVAGIAAGRQPERSFERRTSLWDRARDRDRAGLARAHRVSYVGELGWELYVSTDQAAHVFEAIEEAGAGSG